MKHAILALVALVSLASGSGCCCLERLFCCHKTCVPYGDCCDSGCGGGCCDTGCGVGGHCATGGCDSCGLAGHPHHGHPLLHHHRNAGGQHEFAAGPPTGAVTYPYYTSRGPRDFLAKNPRGIGP